MEEESGETDFEPDTQRIGETVVSAFLWERGYSTIDYIVASHADADHIQGLVDVAENFSVRRAFFGRTPATSPNFTELAAVLKKRSIPFATLSRGDRFDIGGVVVETILPTTAEAPDEPSGNNESVVMRFSFGRKSILMTGDIEKKAENEGLTLPELLAADVVKVPHHGSKTSSTPAFVDAVRASLAVISVGRRSVFGHPNKDVVERWQQANANVITTGMAGTITVVTDGNEMWFYTYVN
jgi:competence protein ComEC